MWLFGYFRNSLIICFQELSNSKKEKENKPANFDKNPIAQVL